MGSVVEEAWVGFHLENSESIAERWWGRRRRAKEDHPVITLALRNPLLSLRHSQEAHSSHLLIFIH